MPKIIFLRHGESIWNHQARFTGWADIPLSEKGKKEARLSGQQMKKAGVVFDIAYTSLLKRTIQTLWLILEEMDMFWIPVVSSWYLNERHYGALQGLTKSEAIEQYGSEKVQLYCRGYEVQPPKLEKSDPRYVGHDPRYALLTPDQIPAAESIQEALARFLPYWHDAILPKMQSGNNILVVSHGNILRAMISYLHSLSSQASSLSSDQEDIETAKPLVYEFGQDMKPINRYYLHD